MSIINSIRRFIFNLPGKRFGYYRVIPIFVVAGAGLEYLMITWRPFGVNFYEVYKRKQAKEIAESRLNEER
ncbi:small integral membrane protein 4 [Rhopalosiphum maidis]|uniref:small integral membrane protein 4 n=1 Tax=Rhopalosiphum maidis TaxID=43146 RepID=UPI000EFF077F|nr:small integral membrane protein 4 [Rhopalosiphum maidis]